MTGDRGRDVHGRRGVVSIHARRVTGDHDPSALSLQHRAVSIHARRVTGDAKLFGERLEVLVSIHARRVTGDLLHAVSWRQDGGFNSRPSCDGRHIQLAAQDLFGVSIHARRVTGDRVRHRLQAARRVSIHARRVTGDVAVTGGIAADLFQFTPVV